MAVQLTGPFGNSSDLANVPLVSTGGKSTTSVPTGAANTVISAAAGRLCRIIVSTAGTAAAAPGCPIYDNATTNSGTVLFNVPGNAAAATSYDIQMPAANGITAANVVNGPVFTVSYY